MDTIYVNVSVTVTLPAFRLCTRIVTVLPALTHPLKTRSVVTPPSCTPSWTMEPVVAPVTVHVVSTTEPAAIVTPDRAHVPLSKLVIFALPAVRDKPIPASATNSIAVLTYSFLTDKAVVPADVFSRT